MPAARSWPRIAAVTVPVVVGLGFVSALVSGNGGIWFWSLRKPALMPPDAAFPIAWTILYVLLGVALARVMAARDGVEHRQATMIFAMQLLLNYLWSPLFFGAHMIVPALLLILVILALAIAATFAFAAVERTAARLMLPYLAWLGFAAALNWDLYRLNGG